MPNPAARNGHEAPIAPPAPASPSKAYPIAPGIVDAPTTVFAVLTAPVKVFPSPVLANTVEGTFKAGDGPNWRDFENIPSASPEIVSGKVNADDRSIITDVNDASAGSSCAIR